MKWTTEDTGAKERRIKEKYGNWHPCFAWLPVRAAYKDGITQWVWFEKLFRRAIRLNGITKKPFWEYRTDLFEVLKTPDLNEPYQTKWPNPPPSNPSGLPAITKFPQMPAKPTPPPGRKFSGLI